MANQAWKSEERAAATLLAGRRFPANSGGRVDVESPRFLAQVKHRRVCSLAELERLAVELETLGAQADKAGIVVVKRRAGAGCKTTRLVVMTDQVFVKLTTSATEGAGDCGANDAE